MKPVDGQDGKVDQQAEMFIRSFPERTLSETARLEAATAGARPPQTPVTSTTFGQGLRADAPTLEVQDIPRCMSVNEESAVTRARFH